MPKQVKETENERTPFDVVLAESIMTHVEDGLELTTDRILGMIDLARVQTKSSE